MSLRNGNNARFRYNSQRNSRWHRTFHPKAICRISQLARGAAEIADTIGGKWIANPSNDAVTKNCWVIGRSYVELCRYSTVLNFLDSTESRSSAERYVVRPRWLWSTIRYQLQLRKKPLLSDSWSSYVDLNLIIKFHLRQKHMLGVIANQSSSFRSY